MNEPADRVYADDSQNPQNKQNKCDGNQHSMNEFILIKRLLFFRTLFSTFFAGRFLGNFCTARSSFGNTDRDRLFATGHLFPAAAAFELARFPFVHYLFNFFLRFWSV